MLEVAGLTRRFGGFTAVNNVSFSVRVGEIVGLIGPNGSGKTTTFNLIAGTLAPNAGSVRFEDGEIAGLAAHQVCRRGLARTFQIPRPFRKLSLRNNVALSAYYAQAGAISRAEAERRAVEALDLVGLPAEAHATTHGLGAAALKKLELARALSTGPKPLLANESLGGLDAAEMDRAAEMLETVRTRLGITIIWVEHIMGVLMRVVDRVIVLDHGEKIFEGAPADAIQDQRVQQRFILAADIIEPLLLALSEVSAAYGSFQALFGVSLSVGAGEAVGVIGPNGAGKTTLMRVISGLLAAGSGEVRLLGNSITQYPAHRIVAEGIAHVPENRRLFSRLTVEENLRMGAYIPAARRQLAERLRWVYDLFPRLSERRDQFAGTMSGGEQQMCAIGRALMSRPKILLMDEPSAGLAPLAVEQVFELVRRIRAEGFTVLIVEQNVQQVLALVDRAYLLEAGHIRLSGSAAELRANDAIRKAYMGI